MNREDQGHHIQGWGQLREGNEGGEWFRNGKEFRVVEAWNMRRRKEWQGEKLERETVALEP